jgi:precorrin-2 dehydrogenase / sirohydrochlorin ferrochelatase
VNPYYPIFLDVKGRKCVVVGGGQVALRKVEALLESGAVVTVVSPVIGAGLRDLAANGSIVAMRRAYRSGDLEGACVALTATDSENTNARVAKDAWSDGVLINVADDPAKSSFIVPSTILRGDLTVAISTGGKSPALARKVRRELEKNLVPEYALLVDIVGEVRRDLLNQKIEVSSERWQEALDLKRLVDLIARGKRGQAKSLLLSKLIADDTVGDSK